MTIDIPQKLYRLILVVAFGFSAGAGFQAAASHLWAAEAIKAAPAAEAIIKEREFLRSENTTLRNRLTEATSEDNSTP